MIFCVVKELKKANSVHSVSVDTLGSIDNTLGRYVDINRDKVKFISAQIASMDPAPW